MNLYPVDSSVQFVDTYSLKSNIDSLDSIICPLKTGSGLQLGLKHSHLLESVCDIYLIVRCSLEDDGSLGVGT